MQGQYFRYAISIWVTNGEGQYDGYHDDLNSKGTYTVLGQTATHATFQAEYSWRYSNNEGLKQSGSENRIVEFDIRTRLYTSSRTDLDEWDGEDPSTLSVWFWIPTDVQVGSSVKILDSLYLVRSLDASVWSNLAPKKGIEVYAEGS